MVANVFVAIGFAVAFGGLAGIFISDMMFKRLAAALAAMAGAALSASAVNAPELVWALLIAAIAVSALGATALARLKSAGVGTDVTLAVSADQQDE